MYVVDSNINCMICEYLDLTMICYKLYGSYTLTVILIGKKVGC